MNNYHALKQHIADLAIQYGRDPKEITLVAVTKGHKWNEIEPLYQAGQRKFGESRQQEASDKMLEAPNDAEWHFIGSLQQNKVRKIIGKFALIHSVDSPALAKKISECSQEAGVETGVLLQVNTSGETSKHGLSVEEWRRHIDSVNKIQGIKTQGFMTMAPLTDDKEVIRKCFRKLREFRDELGEKSWYLSMGMSHDYPLAIAEGATHLRVGSLLFE